MVYSMKRIIGKILIALGMLIIFSILYMNYKTYKSNKEMIEQYKSAIDNNNIQKDEYKIGDVIGVLNIPKIGIEVAIKRGVSDEILDTAIGHFDNTSMPGEYGNFAVAGHRAYTKNKFFSNLDKIEIGDEINILQNRINHKYIVDSIEIVEPDRVDVVESKDMNKKEITLVTCTPKYVGSHRLIVKGTYVEICNKM